MREIIIGLEKSMTVKDYRELVAWLVDKNRKSPELAFSNGSIRWAADAVIASGILQAEQPQEKPRDCNVEGHSQDCGHWF